jgi:hypothetical protein
MVRIELLVLWTHIGAGVLAVLAGLVALGTKKGGLAHRRAGTGFVASMAAVAATAIVLYPLGPTRFRLILALIALFSFYLVFSGYRVLTGGLSTNEAAPIDWIGVAVVLLAGGGLLVAGLLWALRGQAFGPVFLAFGAIGTAFGGLDARRFRSEETSGPRIVLHLQRMLAGYIAAISAVSAVNLTALPPYVSWLWPTVVGTPLIYWWSRRYS